MTLRSRFPAAIHPRRVKNTPVTLADGTLVLLPNGEQTALPGDLVLTEPRGLRVTVPGGKETIPFGTRVKLVAKCGGGASERFDRNDPAQHGTRPARLQTAAKALRGDFLQRAHITPPS